MLPNSEDMHRIAMGFLTWTFFEEASAAIKAEVAEARGCGEFRSGGVEPMEKLVIEFIKRARISAAAGDDLERPNATRVVKHRHVHHDKEAKIQGAQGAGKGGLKNRSTSLPILSTSAALKKETRRSDDEKGKVKGDDRQWCSGILPS